MKKNNNLIKRLLSLVAAAVMVVGMTAGTGVTALADTTEKITLSVKTQTQEDQNTTPEEYLAFKIFDATKNSDTVGDTTDQSIKNQNAANAANGVSYFLPSDSKWKDIATNAQLTPYLNFTAAADGSGWTVTWNLYNASNNQSGKEYTEANAIALADILNSFITVNRAEDGTITSVTVNAGNSGAQTLTSGTDYWTVTTSKAQDVPIGYYLVTSSLGSNLILATTDITITEKNDYPTADKKITKTSDETAAFNTPATSTDAQIGDTINYKLTANVPQGAVNELRLHDTMSTALSLDLGRTDGIFTVKLGNETVPQTTDLGEGNTRTNWTIQYSSETTKLSTTGKGTQAGVTSTTTGATGSSLKTNDSFVVIFSADYIKSIADSESKVLTVEYDAILNNNAKLATDKEDNTNKNKVRIEYSNYTTQEQETTVYTHEFDLVKYFEEKNEGTTSKVLLPGAVFNIYRDDQVENGKLKANAQPVDVIKQQDGSYRVWDGLNVDSDESKRPVFDLESTDGKYNIEGLDVGTYYLEEREAPDGYNKLENLIRIDVTQATEDAKVIGTNVKASEDASESNGTITYTMATEASTGVATTVAASDGNPATYTSGGVAVLNQAGTVLPSTGGIGTTIFYVIGGVLVAGAVVLLVLRRRKNA